MSRRPRIQSFYIRRKAAAFLWLTASLLLTITTFGQTKKEAVKGVLDLRNYRWDKSGLANLNGEWEFYWNDLYTPAALDSTHLQPPRYASVPNFWNSALPNNIGLLQPAFGFATYRLTILCPPTSEKLALKFLTVASAYKLFVNGKEALEMGKVGTTKETTTPDFQPIIIPVTPENGKLSLVIQVSNFTYNAGGLWDFIKLGTASGVQRYYVKDIAAEYFIAGSFFLIGIFHLVIFLFFRRTNASFYFAVFCLLLGIRVLVTGELGILYIANINWQAVKHIEYTTLYLSLPVLALFSYELFRKDFSLKVLRVVLVISIPFVSAALFTTPFFFRYTLRPFQFTMLLTACYGMYAYITAVKNKRVGAVYFLAGFVVLILSVVNDVLFTSLIINTTNLSYIGLYILVICQAATLSKQFFGAFIKVEKLNDELNEMNATINERNEQLHTLNAEMDTLVYRTSHDLRSPITSIYTLAELITVEKNEPKRIEYLQYQKKTLKRLDGLIGEILQYAKNKSTALQFDEINLKDFIEDVLSDHRFSNDAHDIERRVEIDQQYPFVTDASRLSMIVNNLVSNALKYYNKEEPQPFIQIKIAVAKGAAEIIICDNGQGIPQEHLDYIFTKFYKVNNGSSGSGFGLHVVKEAVEKLGGTISVASEIKKGTTFTVVLPNLQKASEN